MTLGECFMVGSQREGAQECVLALGDEVTIHVEFWNSGHGHWKYKVYRDDILADRKTFLFNELASNEWRLSV